MNQENLMEATHPGDISHNDLISGTEKAREWYNNAVWYGARLYVESAQEHAEVREALLNDERDPQRTVAKHDREVYDEITDMGLSAFQGLSAEQTAARYLKEEDCI